VVKAKKSNNAFYILLAVVAVGGIAALAYLSTRHNDAQGASPIDPSLPPVKSEGYVIGSASAPVEVTEFADFECPACERFASITEPDVRARLVNAGTIRMRFIDFPLPMHRNTWNASRAAACADAQGKFWPMHDLIYANQDQWNGEVTSNPDKVLKDVAKQVPGLDAGKFNSCVDSKEMQAKIQAHYNIAEQRQIRETPTFYIGDQKFEGALPYDEFKKQVDLAVAKAPKSAPAVGGGDTALSGASKSNASAPKKK
jgi:protein-disulfide isomerase